jgi:hypothetical protein
MKTIAAIILHMEHSASDIDGVISRRKSKTGTPSGPSDLGSIAKMARKSIDRHRAQ